MLLRFLQTLSLVSSGLFAGACLYVVVVAMPVRRKRPAREALSDFRQSLARSEKMQPALHVVSMLSTIATALLSQQMHVYVGLAILAPILPLSFLFGIPVYKKLQAETMQPDDPSMFELLDHFTRVQTIRTILSIVGFGALSAK